MYIMDAHLIKNVISNTDLTILKRIHLTNRSQDNLKKTLIKFDLGSSAVINPDFSFNIWCRPQTDGAGDFSLINKIAKELKSYGIPNRSINFAIGVTKFSTFLRELSEFVRKVDELNIIVREATAKMEEVNPHMQNILGGLRLLKFTRDSTTNQHNIIKNFDNTRTHYTEEFNVDLGEGITQNDRIRFVIMEKYDDSLDSLNFSILNRSQKYDIAEYIINHKL